MLKAVIKGFTHVFGKPEGWSDTESTEIRDLHIRKTYLRDGNWVYSSAWTPTPAELATLNDGGLIVVHVVGCQPPIAVDVEQRETD